LLGTVALRGALVGVVVGAWHKGWGVGERAADEHVAAILKDEVGVGVDFEV